MNKFARLLILRRLIIKHGDMKSRGVKKKRYEAYTSYLQSIVAKI